MNCFLPRRFVGLSLAAVTIFLLLYGVGLRTGCAKERITDEVIDSYYDCIDRSITSVARGLNEDKEFQAEVWGILRESKKLKKRDLAYKLIVWAKLAGYEDLIRKSGKDVSYLVRVSRVFDLPKVYKGEELVDAYIEMLSDKSYVVRYEVAEQLAEHPSKKAVEPLLTLLADESIEVRDRAMGSLYRFNLPEVKTRLKELAKDKNPTVAGTATAWLLRYGEREVDLSLVNALLVAELLPRRLYGGDNVRALVRLLAEHGDATSLVALKKAASSKDPHVAEEAKRAIETLEKRIAK